MKPCDMCMVAKVKHKNVPKETDSMVVTKEAGQIYLDISILRSRN
jgi:hypothetical protein